MRATLGPPLVDQARTTHRPQTVTAASIARLATMTAGWNELPRSVEIRTRSQNEMSVELPSA